MCHATACHSGLIGSNSKYKFWCSSGYKFLCVCDSVWVVFIVVIQNILQNKRLNFESGHIALFSSNLQSDFVFYCICLLLGLTTVCESLLPQNQTPEGKHSNHPLRPRRLCRPEICQGCWRKQQTQIKQKLQEARRHFSEPLITDMTQRDSTVILYFWIIEFKPSEFLKYFTKYNFPPQAWTCSH